MFDTLTTFKPLNIVIILAIAIPAISAGSVIVNATHEVEKASNKRFEQFDQLDKL